MDIVISDPYKIYLPITIIILTIVPPFSYMHIVPTRQIGSSPPLQLNDTTSMF